MRRLFVAFAAIAVIAGTARAEDYEASGGTSKGYRHGGQFKLYAQLGESYRVIFRYDENDYCGEAGETLCKGVTPPWMELGIGYGISDSFEILTDVRLGLGADFPPPATGTGGSTSGPHAFVIAPGIRVFIDDAGSLKFFSTFQLALDFTDYSASGVSESMDVAIRNVFGLLVDLHRTFGVYVHVGDTFGFVRWFRFEVDGGIGLMVRLP